MEKLEMLPERLKYFRLQRKMTRKEVCVALNVTPSALSHWEAGSRTPSADSLLELCSLYGIRSVAQLFGNDDIPTEEISPDEMELLTMYRSADTQGKNAALKLLKGWLI